MATYEVSGGGSALQDQINLCVTGDIINVIDTEPTIYDPIEIFAEYTYNDDGTIASTTYKDITINGVNGPSICIIDATGHVNSERVFEDVKTGTISFQLRVGDSDCRCVHYAKVDTSAETGLIISGFTLRGGHTSSIITQEIDPVDGESKRCWTGLVGCAAVYGCVQLIDCIIEECNFVNKELPSGANMHSNSGNNCLMARGSYCLPHTRCIFRNNNLTIGYSGGMSFYGDYQCGVINYSAFNRCIFTQNTFNISYGGSTFGGRNLINNSIIWGNTYTFTWGSSFDTFVLGCRIGNTSLPKMRYTCCNNISEIKFHVTGCMARIFHSNNFLKFKVFDWNNKVDIELDENGEYEDFNCIIKNIIYGDDPMLDENFVPLPNSPCKGMGTRNYLNDYSDLYGKPFNYPHDIGPSTTELEDPIYTHEYPYNITTLDTSKFNNIIYVDKNATGNNDGSSWENAYNSLVLKIDKSDTIVLVKPGTYTYAENYNSEKSIIVTNSGLSNIVIQSTEGPLNTVVDCGNINRFATFNGKTSLIGFSITNASVSDAGTAYIIATGMNSTSSETYNLEYCIIHNCRSNIANVLNAGIRNCKSILNCLFYKNTGLIYTAIPGFKIENSNFINNYNIDSSCQLIRIDSSPSNITNCKFINNNFKNDYIIVIYANYGYIDNSTFEGNISKHGVIYAGSSSNEIIRNCKFINNLKPFFGSLGCVSNSLYCEFHKCDFIGNHAWHAGGALQSSYAYDCLFKHNTCGIGYGGGACFETKTYNCMFIDNMSMYSGSHTRYGILENCEIIGGKCINTNSEYGYACMHSGMSNCKIHDVIEKFRGSALLNTGIRNSFIYNNIMVNVPGQHRRGGIFYARSSSIYNNIIYNNKVSWHLMCRSEVYNCIFIDNEVDWSFIMYENGAKDAKIINSVFKGNTFKKYPTGQSTNTTEEGTDYTGTIQIGVNGIFSNNIFDNTTGSLPTTCTIGPNLYDAEIELTEDFKPTKDSIVVGFGNREYLQSNNDLANEYWNKNPAVGCYEYKLRNKLPNSLYPIGESANIN